MPVLIAGMASDLDLRSLHSVSTLVTVFFYKSSLFLFSRLWYTGPRNK